jgi:hypothetical protein
MNVLANGWTRSQNARSVGSPLTAYPMSMATKSISSYLPIRARTNRTRSSMALRIPCRWSACVTTTTSPNQGGVLGVFVGSTWIWTTESVIFLSSLSHSFSLRMTHFCRLCSFFRAFSPLWLTRCVSRGYGRVLGHRQGVTGDQLLSYTEARYLIYLPSYRWVLEHCLQDLITELKQLEPEKPVVFLDYETNSDITVLTRPLSHAGLIKLYLQDNWPVLSELREGLALKIVCKVC